MPARVRPFRLTPPEPSERQLHEAVAQALRLLILPPVMWTCFPAGHVPLPPASAAALQRAGLQRGWPDLLFIHAGQAFGIELKPAAGKLPRTRTVRTRRGSLRVVERQTDVFPRLEAAGMTLAVCRSVDAVTGPVPRLGLAVAGLCHATGCCGGGGGVGQGEGAAQLHAQAVPLDLCGIRQPMSETSPGRA